MIISLANQKGGVGKTTTCINLSAALAEKKERVLIVDLDPQGNTTSGLGLDKNSLESSIYDVLVNGKKIKEVIQDTGRKKLDICPANINLAGAEIELVGVEKREFVLKKALKSVKDDYDVIMIDCPPSLSLLTLNALTASDGLLVPIQAEYYALEGLTQLLETVTAVKKNWNEDLKIFGALVTMYDSRTQLSKQVSDEIHNFFKETCFEHVIPRNVRLSEAPSHSKTIFEYERWSKGAFAYKAVAKEFIKRMKEFKSKD